MAIPCQALNGEGVTTIGSSPSTVSIDPIFRRDADMFSMWELSRDCQGRILKAQKADKKAHPVKD